MLTNRILKIKGTKKFFLKNQLVVSLGLPSLDSVIGGGIPVGSCFLLEEDEYGIYSNIVLKHYLAEGVVNDHTLLLASQDVDTRALVLDLPSPLHVLDNDMNPFKENNEQLRIAWRYKDLSVGSVTDKNVSVFGNTYNLGVQLKSSIVQKTSIHHWEPEPDGYSYDKLFTYIENIVQNPKFNLNVPAQDRTVLRIALYSLGTLLWRGNFITFLIKLRHLLRNYCATCFITLPTHLLKEPKIVQICEHLCDTVLQMKSLKNDGNPAYSDYEGLLILKKLPVINTWACSVPESNDWAFKLKRKHFIVEKLHISPEFTEKVHREGEDVSREYKTQNVLSNVAEQF